MNERIIIKYVKKANMWCKTSLIRIDNKIEKKQEWFNNEELARK